MPVSGLKSHDVWSYPYSWKITYIVTVQRPDSLVPDDCSKFPINNIQDDTVRFAEECAGQETLGFLNRKVFHARLLSEEEFNQLFRNARKTYFEIRIEETTFEKINLPLLAEANRPHSPRSRLFVIRDNDYLTSIDIPDSAFDITEPFHVEIDSNRALDKDTLDRFQKNCRAKINKDCDIFPSDPYSCDALIPTQKHFMRQFTKNCPGAKVIKQAPRDALVLDLSVMGEDTFNNVFKEATHVQMCINVNSTNIKKLHMPKLKRMFPCKKQWHSLNITNNPNLKSVVLGDPDDIERFVINMKVQLNPRLSNKNMRDLNNICRNKNLGTCTIDRDGEEEVLQKTTTQGKPEGQPGGFDEKNSFTQGESPPNRDDRRKTKRTLPPVLNDEENENEDDYGGGWFGGLDIAVKELQDRNKKRERARHKHRKSQSYRSDHPHSIFLFMSIYLLL